MIVKILNSASSDFNGVKYNDKKINTGDGELMGMKNFPSFINKNSSQETVRDYLKAISQSKKVKKPQFHSVISTKFQEHSKEELNKVANEFMKEMGYGKQPFIVVFHNDTDNNHVHIVSSRVDKSTGKKIDDSFEKLKSQKSLSNVMEKLYGIKVERDLEILLKYKYTSEKQLETLLNRNGFKLVPNTNDDSKLDVLKNGVKKITLTNLELNENDENRKKQLKAIFHKYKNHYSNQVFKVVDDREQKGRENESLNKKAKIKFEFESELQHNFRKMFGVDIVFHNKDDKDPFGYSVIDNKTGNVFKGSEIMKMKELFEFTSDSIDKQTFEKLKAYNVSKETEKKCLLKYFREQKKDVKDFMIFYNKGRKTLDDYKSLKKDVIDSIINNKKNENISIIKSENGSFYSVHSKYNHIQELESLVGKNVYEKFLHPNQDIGQDMEVKSGIKNESLVDDLVKELSKSTFGKDPFDDEYKKRKKKKR